MIELEIYLLCRDRPEFFVETLNSIISQNTELSYEIVISDNSEGEKVKILAEERYANLKYVRRLPNLSSFEHFNKVIQEANSKYLVIFHDDDIMCKDFISNAIYQFSIDPSLVAVACNANFMIGDRLTKRSMMGPVKWITRRISIPLEFLVSYLKISPFGPAPFPGYMYQTLAIKKLTFNPDDGGKHSDITFLLKLLKKGPILWMSRALMIYRVHSGSDSSTESIKDRLSLLRFINRSTWISGVKNELIIDYKYKYWLSWYRKSENTRKSNRRFKTIRNFLIKRTFYIATTSLYLWIKLIDICIIKGQSVFMRMISNLKTVILKRK